VSATRRNPVGAACSAWQMLACYTLAARKPARSHLAWLPLPKNVPGRGASPAYLDEPGNVGRMFIPGPPIAYLDKPDEREHFPSPTLS